MIDLTTTSRGGARIRIASEVLDERARQDAKWGEQNHLDGTGPLFRPVADAARSTCEAAFTTGQGTWQHILAEEFYEAVAETDPQKLRTELIQVAAVAIAWAEAIDRRDADGEVDRG